MTRKLTPKQEERLDKVLLPILADVTFPPPPTPPRQRFGPPTLVELEDCPHCRMAREIKP